MGHYLKLKDELKVEKWAVEAAVKLIDEGKIPFLLSPDTVRRRRVSHDEVLRDLHER